MSENVVTVEVADIADVPTFDDFGSDGDLLDGKSDDIGNVNSNSFDAFEDDMSDISDKQNQSSLLDEKSKQEAKNEKNKKGKPSDEDEESNESEEDGEQEEEERTEEEVIEKPKVKTSKGKFGEESIDVPDEATFAVTIGGKKEYVKFSDLKNNYSGKVSYESKFQDLNKENLKIKSEKEKIETHTSELMDKVKEVKTLLDPSNEKVSPFAAIEYICNLTGINPVEYNKRMIDHLAPVIAQMSDMTEREIDGYWATLENEYLKNNQAAAARKQQEDDGLKEQNLKFSKQLESLGITDDDYSIGVQELKSIGFSDMTENPEQVIKWIKMKPLYELVEKATPDFRDFFEDDAEFNKFTDDLVLHLMENPDDAKNEESVKQFLIETFDIPEKIVEKIEKSFPAKQTPKKVAKKELSEESIELFTDFDY